MVAEWIQFFPVGWEARNSCKCGAVLLPPLTPVGYFLPGCDQGARVAPLGILKLNTENYRSEPAILAASSGPDWPPLTPTRTSENGKIAK